MMIIRLLWSSCFPTLGDSEKTVSQLLQALPTPFSGEEGSVTIV